MVTLSILVALTWSAGWARVAVAGDVPSDGRIGGDAGLVPAAPVADEAPSDQGLTPFTDSERQEAVTRASAATVRLVARSCGGRVFGTAFAADGVLVTNRHVVAGATAARVDRATVLGDGVLEEGVLEDGVLGDGAPSAGAEMVNDPGLVADAEVVERFSEVDIALLTLPGELDELTIDRSPSVQGQPVLAIGHPGGRSVPVVVEAAVVSVVGGDAYGVDGDVMLLDARTEPGFSGGPVVNRRGELVAVLQGYDPVTELSLAIPAADIVDQLDGARPMMSQGSTCIENDGHQE